MFLISWNVAGWTATASAIREAYGSVEYFLDLTGADIICIQECKGSLTKLKDNPVEMGASDPPSSKRRAVEPVLLPGASAPSPSPPASPSAPSSTGMHKWESFWSLSGKAHRGFNGVVTFVKTGLTHKCDARPFDSEELNEEGRAVVTCHSAFNIVNVYVPNARGGERSFFKNFFLESLRNVMEKLRVETGKPVILVGDLNMSYRPDDAFWGLRRIHIGDLIRLNYKAESASDEEWQKEVSEVPKPSLRRLTNAVINTLCQAVVEVCHGNRDGNNNKRSVTQTPPSASVAKAGTGVVSVDAQVSAPVVSPQDAKVKALLERITSSPQGRSLPVSGSSLFSEPPPVSLQDLYDAGFTSTSVQHIMSGSSVSLNREVYALIQYCGLPPHGDDAIRFMATITKQKLRSATEDAVSIGDEDGTRMWDTFLLEDKDGAAYCPCPFTCWDQSRNRRATNEGTRLDYIMVDDGLVPLVMPRSNTENNVGFYKSAEDSAVSAPEEKDFYSQFSGRERIDSARRAMADGAYPTAPFDGSGLPPLEMHARAHPFRGFPSTGLFVTPPQFSDHIGVCVRFKDTLVLQPRAGKLVEANGVKCMYRAPVGLHSFFSRVKPPAQCESAEKKARVETTVNNIDATSGTDVIDVDDDSG